MVSDGKRWRFQKTVSHMHKFLERGRYQGLKWGFVVARQELYHMSHSTNPFKMVIFKIGSLCVLWLAWSVILLFGLTAVCHCTQPLIDMGFSQTFCLGWLHTVIFLHN
jgi:hypothetical protein